MESGSRGMGVGRKLVVAMVIGAIVWFGSGFLEFPFVFQVMFVSYVLLGLLVFLLLEAPPMPRLSGWKAGLTLVGFYLVVSAVFVLGASTLPQFDPADEQQKIAKLLKHKRKALVSEEADPDKLLKKAEKLEAKAQVLLARVNELAPASEQGEKTMTASLGSMAGKPDIVQRGREVYELYECYNCHTIEGKGASKSRGPKLDNIGSLLSVKDIKKKVLDPGYLYAEGFEEQHKKGKMPDKYNDLMTEEEVTALATYLNTLQDSNVDTPKPIFVKADVQHGFTVYGYVRDKDGKPVSNVKVEAVPQKDHAHPGSATTNEAGYFEIFLHMHNEDAGTKVVVKAKDVKEEFVANYDPRDTQTRRQASVNLVVPTG